MSKVYLSRIARATSPCSPAVTTETTLTYQTWKRNCHRLRLRTCCSRAIGQNRTTFHERTLQVRHTSVHEVKLQFYLCSFVIARFVNPLWIRVTTTCIMTPTIVSYTAHGEPYERNTLFQNRHIKNNEQKSQRARTNWKIAIIRDVTKRIVRTYKQKSQTHKSKAVT